jgi:hypothetical protein
MATYTVQVSNTALSTTNDLLTLLPAANHPIQIVEISIAGMGTASAANELGVYRSTGGTTGGGAVTPTPVGKYLSASNTPASATVCDTTWAAQPTLGGKVLALGVNANGGIYRWVARPGEEIVCANTDQISLRSAVGTSSVSVHVVFTEDFL